LSDNQSIQGNSTSLQMLQQTKQAFLDLPYVIGESNGAKIMIGDLETKTGTMM
jgi:hypothetical protein